MPDLSTQLREYFDATALPVEVEEVMSDDPWVPARQTPQRKVSTNWRYGVAVAAVLALIVGLAMLMPGGSGGEVADSTPPTGSESLFAGTWTATDNDGSQATTLFEVGTEGVDMVQIDDHASVCSGAPSTMTGTGRLDEGTTVVIPTPSFTCDGGTEPAALSGPPLDDQLRNLTFTYDVSNDTITDNFGLVWSRSGSGAPSSGSVSTGWWPQTNLEDVAKAQESADAGDPDYTWQVSAVLAAESEPWDEEIFTRFLRESLGWEEFAFGFNIVGYGTSSGSYMGVVYIRCAPGEANFLYPTDPIGSRCAPTVDGRRYETVGISASQPGLRGPSGIWVVTGWEEFQPRAYADLFDVIYPDFSERQVEQEVPPSDDDVTALLESFLQARVDGEGAEQYLIQDSEPSPRNFVPLLYAASNDAPYQRFELEKVRGPVWPSGWMEYRTRLFADDGTVVEQSFHIVRFEGKLGLAYGYFYDDGVTTEDGQPVVVPFSLVDGGVTFDANPDRVDWASPVDRPAAMGFGGGREHIVIAAESLPVETGCQHPPDASGAEVLSESILSDPDFELTSKQVVRIAGIEGIQIDGVVTAQWDTSWSLCYPTWSTNAEEFLIRLYLVDYPGQSDSMVTLAVISPEEGLPRLLEEAEHMVESLAIRAR